MSHPSIRFGLDRRKSCSRWIRQDDASTNAYDLVTWDRILGSDTEQQENKLIVIKKAHSLRGLFSGQNLNIWYLCARMATLRWPGMVTWTAPLSPILRSLDNLILIWLCSSGWFRGFQDFIWSSHMEMMMIAECGLHVSTNYLWLEQKVNLFPSALPCSCVTPIPISDPDYDSGASSSPSQPHTYFTGSWRWWRLLFFSFFEVVDWMKIDFDSWKKIEIKWWRSILMKLAIRVLFCQMAIKRTVLVHERKPFVFLPGYVWWG